MQTKVQEFYARHVLPMSEPERRKLADLITGDLPKEPDAGGAVEAPKRNGDITKFFGMFDSGNSDSADNEQIDRDLARAYADNHEGEN